MGFVKIDDLNFRYSNSREDVLKDFSLSIGRGEIVAVVGRSGSGKSTLLRILSGFELPYKGKLEIDERILVSEDIYVPVEKRRVGMVFQDYALFPHLTVEENIRYGIEKMSKKEQKKRVEEVLGLVDMGEYSKRYPHELSGGQQQRIGLARALAPRPEFILLDEPFSNLDTSLRHRIRDELKEIIKSTGTTALFVTHDKEDALSVADKVVVLKEGKIAQVGTPLEITMEPACTYVEEFFRGEVSPRELKGA